MKPPDVEHLYFDGRHYDQRYRDVTRDIPFWIEQARRYGDPVLELACGTGRVALPLAKEGFRVTGIDISDSMLAQARRKASQEGIAVEWVKADVRDVELGKRFSLVIFPANAICHLLELEDFEACLACVRRHLSTEGRLIIDVFNPRLDILLRDSAKRYPHGEYPDPDGKGTVVVTENNVYDRASQVNHIKLFYRLPGQEDELVEELKMRIYFPQELDALLKYNGFVIESKFGDYDEKPFASDSPHQLIVCAMSK
jgi:ubiquinone/menaquinone biosynthesis C-methylase UbiE